MAVSLLSSAQQQALLENEQLRDEVKELKRLLFGSKKERSALTADEAHVDLTLNIFLSTLLSPKI